MQESYSYRAPTTNTLTGQLASVTHTAANYSATYSYTYDVRGNIASVSDGTYTTTYVYDTANQLVRENNQEAGITTTWTYDDGGNILNKKTYVYTTGTLGAATDTVSYTYGDTEWGDLLTAYDGQTITHDGIGNPLNDGTWTYTWEHGRQLASMTDGSTTWDYSYNSDGLRTTRTNGTTTYEYTYNGDRLSQLVINNNGTVYTLYFIYDADGPMAVNTNGTTYYYVKNAQGDITALVNKSDTAVVEYTYDAWGNILSITGDYANSLGKRNPLRYRGYVYDVETELYYLNSRYYDPELCRFISADSIAYLGAGNSPLGYNLFTYCLNNPINYVDIYGNAPIGVLTIHDYYLIHKMVQIDCCVKWGWSMEVYIVGPKGLGRLDLYDTTTHSYYEVKSEGASKRKSTETQMQKYDVGMVYSARFPDAPTYSPERGTQLVSGKFSYGVYDVEYTSTSPGLIVYTVTPNWERVQAVATVAAVIGLVVFSQGAAIPLVGTIPLLA